MTCGSKAASAAWPAFAAPDRSSRFGGHLLLDDDRSGHGERDQGQDGSKPIFHESGFYRLAAPRQWSGLGGGLV